MSVISLRIRFGIPFPPEAFLGEAYLMAFLISFAVINPMM